MDVEKTDPAEQQSKEAIIADAGPPSSIRAGSPLPGPDDETSNSDDIIYLQGPRLWGITAVIASMFFLTMIDITIATTSLVAITRDLGGFETASWILTSYQLGYVAVIVIFAKLSDVFGRKLVLVGCIVGFTIFSGGCAAAQTIEQLIILRAFQGLGAGGCFTLSATVLLESVHPAQYGSSVAKTGLAVILAMVLGPILGGAISEHTTWRWIFLINLPVGVIVVVLALVSIPSGFPYHGRRSELGHMGTGMLWSKIDLPGSLLLILATLSFTSCFQEADSRFPWNSAYVITLLILSVVIWALLLLWERHVTLASKVREPVLPWRFFSSRVILGLLLGFVFVGGPLAVAYFQLPQRFQLVNGLSSLDAAVRVLPFGVASSTGTVLSGRVAGKAKIPAIYIVLFGAVLQVIGFALLGTLHETGGIEPATYGYMVLGGMGCGISYSTMILIVPFAAEKRDGAVAMGAANQFRIMGGAIGLAIVTSVFNGYVRSQFARLNISVPITDLAGGAELTLPPSLQDDMRRVLSEAYNHQMLVLCALGAAQIPASLLMWKRKQIITA